MRINSRAIEVGMVTGYREITIRWCRECDRIVRFTEGHTREPAMMCRYHPEEHIRYTDIRMEDKEDVRPD